MKRERFGNDIFRDVELDITNLHARLLRIVIGYLTDWNQGLAGPVSNTKLRRWGWLKIKRRKMGYYD